MSSIPITWTSNILNDPKAKKAFEDTLLNNTIVLDRLREILYEKEQSLTDTLFSLSTPKDTKDVLIGKISELRDIIKLLNIG